ncbi:GDSL-type esterase/lipase family protein [Brachybacterium alimentarium]|uniref:GDSL-type esterase/lipase family protein n=1 Tax=Brachybacterium alimentarium TaxID=47845 RepID=UPI003FD39D2A
MSSPIPSLQHLPLSAPARRAVLSGLGAAALGAAVLGVARPAAADDAARATEDGTRRFDFGPGAVARGADQVTAATAYTPDLGYGFADTTTLTEADRGGEDPLRGDFVSTGSTATFLVDLPPADYRLTILSGDVEGPTDIAVIAEEIAVVEPTTAAAGEVLELEFDLALVSEQLALTVTGTAAHLNSLVIEALPARRRGKRPTVHLLGDSTMQTYDPYWMPQAGWGQFFERFLSDRVLVDNRSIGGRSSRSFLEQGRLDEVLRRVRPGDYVYVQFGHNDATSTVPDRYTPPEDFREYLRTYIEGTRQRGGEAIVVTPVSRRDYDADTGLFAVSFPEYVEAAISIADELDAPLVDLSASSRAFLDELGPEGAKGVFLHADAGVYPNRPGGVADDTHFQEYGAIQMARLVGRDTAELGLRLSDHVMLHGSGDAPRAVDGLELVRASASTLEVSWTASEDADTYRVHAGPVGEDPVFVGGTAGTEAAIHFLEEAAEYEVRVTAQNEHGEEERGPVLTASTSEAVARFDMGTADSPLQDGFAQVTPETDYTADRGYGLADAGSVTAEDRGPDAGGDVSRDMLLGHGSAYRVLVDLPDGAYTAVLTVGDATGSARTDIAVQGEDRSTVAVDGGARQVIELAEVVGGQLELRISGASGHLNGVTIAADAGTGR